MGGLPAELPLHNVAIRDRWGLGADGCVPVVEAARMDNGGDGGALRGLNSVETASQAMWPWQRQTDVCWDLDCRLGGGIDRRESPQRASV